MSLMLIFHVISVCVEQEVEREQVGKREKGGGGRGKPYAHGNLVPLRKKGGLGEVCFLLDLENVSQSPPSLLVPCSLSHSLAVSFCEDFYHLCKDQKKRDFCTVSFGGSDSAP